MNNSFEKLFGTFSDGVLHEAFKGCEIENVRISMENKSIEIDAFFPLVVNYKIIEAAESHLREKLIVNSVTIFPKMPSESFSEEYYSSLVFEANRAIAATNGFFTHSNSRFDGRTLYVELSHGGGDILKGVGADEFMKRLIKKRFSRDVDVQFCGQTELDISEEEIKAFHKKAEEENLIKKGLDPVYASPSKPKEHKVVEGIPLYLETAKPIFGNKITKNPRPLKEI